MLLRITYYYNYYCYFQRFYIFIYSHWTKMSYACLLSFLFAVTFYVKNINAHRLSFRERLLIRLICVYNCFDKYLRQTTYIRSPRVITSQQLSGRILGHSTLQCLKMPSPKLKIYRERVTINYLLQTSSFNCMIRYYLFNLGN